MEGAEESVDHAKDVPAPAALRPTVAGLHINLSGPKLKDGNPFVNWILSLVVPHLFVTSTQ